MQLRFGRNAAWALAEVVTSGVMLFVLYKLVLKYLGVETLGIWSLVLATTSLGRIADLGTATGLSRFVAIALARQDKLLAMAYAETAIITNFFLYFIIALVIWGPVYYFLSFAAQGTGLERARGLLPYALISFTFISIASAVTGALIGQQRSDQKSMVTIVSIIVQLIIACVFVPQYGLPSLAWAQIAQYLLVITAGWILFLKNQTGMWQFTLPVHWNRRIFSELIGFGMKLQAATLVSFLYEPLTKFVMSSVGGLEALGLLEMTQRLVQQTRQLVVMPIQILVPGFAHLNEQAPEDVAPLYHRALSISVVAGLPLMCAVAIFSPFISYIWLGRMSPLFVTFSIILSAAWFANLLAAPAYVLGVSSGRVKWNIVGHVITTVGAPLLGLGLGKLYGATLVIFSNGLLLAAGSLLTMVMNCRILGIRVLPSATDFAGVKTLLRDIVRRARPSVD